MLSDGASSVVLGLIRMHLILLRNKRKSRLRSFESRLGQRTDTSRWEFSSARHSCMASGDSSHPSQQGLALLSTHHIRRKSHTGTQTHTKELAILAP
jgi:hypothetical protein